MIRLQAGFCIAVGCHLLLLAAPLYQAPLNPWPGVQNSSITVRFDSPAPPPVPQKAAADLPPRRPLYFEQERQETAPPKERQPKSSIPEIVKKKRLFAKGKPPPPVNAGVVPPPAVAHRPPQPTESSVVAARPSAGRPTPGRARAARPPVVTEKALPSIGKAYPQNRGNPPPEYPLLARRRGWQGTVRLSVLVLANGHVGTVSVAESSGYPLLDEAAVKAVGRYRFVPGRHGDESVAMQVELPVHFRLQKGGAVNGKPF